MYSLGAVADIELAIKSKAIDDDVMVVCWCDYNKYCRKFNLNWCFSWVFIDCQK